MSDRKYFTMVGALLLAAILILTWTTAQAQDFSVAFTEGARVAMTAERGSSIQVTDPPTPPAPPTTVGPGNLTGCDLMQWHRINVGLPAFFDRIVYRESRCIADPSVRTSCCVGPLQLYVSLHLRDHRLAPRYAACGVRSERDVDGPDDIARHYCAAKALYDVVGDDAWALTR